VMRKMWSIVLMLAVVATARANDATATRPEVVLAQTKPALYKLYQEYRSYIPGLSQYANQQGFRSEFENLGTIVHEQIHIASAVHQGYFIDGIYFEPYLTAEHWPSLRNQDIRPLIQAGEQSIITTVYMPSTPNNGLANILDELNAYGQVIDFICMNEPSSSAKQVTNTVGFLRVLEVYFRALAANPAAYAQLINDRLSGGAVETIVGRGHAALNACGVSAAKIPTPNTDQFRVRFRAQWQKSKRVGFEK